MRKVILALIAVVALVAPVLQASPAAASPGEFVSSINGLRASKGLGGLSTDGALNAQAQRWAQAMADAGKISHNPALGSTPGKWSKVGENVGVGGTPGSIFNALVNSPGHYKNMVEPNFNKIGVGVVVKDGRMYTCHVFAAIPDGGGGNASTARPAAQKPAATSAPRSGTKAVPTTTARSTGTKPKSNPDQGSAPTTAVAAAPAPAPEAAPLTPPPPAPSQRIVAGLAEVGAIAEQG